MKQDPFITKLAKAIAANELRHGAIRKLLLKLAVNGSCRPCWQNSQSYGDYTADVIRWLEKLGIPEHGHHKNGWILKNDAPRGGRCGNIIEINFDR